MKRIIEFLNDAISEMKGYIDGNEHNELEKHDCRVAKEAYEQVLNYVQGLAEEKTVPNLPETTKYEVVIRCWDYPKVAVEPRIVKMGKFDDRAEAEHRAILDAFQFAEELNFGIDETDEDEVPVGERLAFRVDLDADDSVAVVRAWDGDDYWDVQKYEVVRVIENDNAAGEK